MGRTMAENSKLIPAAQYIRMSTEHQQYSTMNQGDAIRDYAEKHGFEIVETYGDEGKSGLNLSGRVQLQRLISEVTTGKAKYRTILVYDISRWGRFQDADEGAHYEYVCKKAGIEVRYCAELFENNGSPTATIIKSVKRAMAAEYSRELSVKVFRGQCNLIKHGFRQGGHAGYGLRRMLIDHRGEKKGFLTVGEHKSLQTDRVVLVPGPEEEIKNVLRIYEMFVREGRTESEIAKTLNGIGVLTDLGKNWTRGTIHQVLANEKYIGNNVFNRTSFKLKQNRVKNPPEEWVRSNGAFASVVDEKMFYLAQGMILERNRKFTNEEMLERLKMLFSRHGKVSAIIIDETNDMPSSSVYRNRFGSLFTAYKLIGYAPDRDFRFIEINKKLRLFHSGTVDHVFKEIEKLANNVELDHRTGLLTVNGEFTVSINICRHKTTSIGHSRWIIRVDHGLRPDITVAVRMDENNEYPLDYYLIPLIDTTFENLRVAEENGAYLDTYRFDELSYLFGMAEHIKLMQVG